MARPRVKSKTAKILKDVKAVALWLAEEGYKVSMRTVYNHAEGPAFPFQQKGGGYLVEQIETYANATWENPKKAIEMNTVKPGTSAQSLDSKARILAADAAMREFKLDILKGKYYLKSEEDQRDALVLYGIKTAVENWAPFIIQDLISLAGSELGGDAAASIARVIPELHARYSNLVAEKFDELSHKVGVDSD